MRIPRSTLLAGVLTSVLLGGTAHAAAAPAYKPVLTANPVYKSGELDLGTCQEEQAAPGDPQDVKKYLTGVLDCLNEAWAPKIRKAGYKFSKPSFQVITKLGAKTGCGRFPAGAQALYCTRNNKITYWLSPDFLRNPDDLRLMAVLAHEYGHHVQQLTGMLDAGTEYTGKNTRRVLDESRRYELQAECLGAAFIGDVWHSLGRSHDDWYYLVRNNGSGSFLSVFGLKDPGEETHGGGANVGYWLERGFAKESAAACNTWKAPKSKVS
ncbi:neutral zinc metallopeptidase [Nonomuraea wenchangensis]|uniref:neutral zinc metallopeptidase n=1 Tax=Nonomuraea wenchangensis TaxID=568860 RepID=UPI003321285C